MRARSRLLLSLACLPLLLFFWQRGLNEPDEGRYVEIAREMVAGGDHLTPRLKGVPHYAKPPLSYWAIAAGIRVFGHEEFAVRLPGVVAALLVLLLVHDLGRRLGGDEDSGLVAVLVLSGMIEFLALARIVTTDMLHCLFITAAIWAFTRAELEPERRRTFNLAAFAALGLGFLNKGPVPLAVVVAGLAAASVLRRDLALFRRRDWLFGLPLLLAIGLPWYLVVAARDPELYSFFIGGEVVDRVASGRGRAKPFWYFLVVLPLGMLPMTPLVIRAVARLLRDRAAPHRAWLLGFLVGPFLLFSLSASKLWTYVLPLLPVAALIAALARSRPVGRSLLALWSLGLLLALGGDLVAERRALELGNNVSYRRVAAHFEGEAFRGLPIPSSIEAATEAPRFGRASGTRIATYRLRFGAAAFYLLRERAEYLPVYGLDSLWEWESRAARDRVLGLDDLVAELRKPEPMLVLLKARDLDELQRAHDGVLEIDETFGAGPEAVVACRNYRLP